jgi:hypothetical protein
MSLDMHLFQAVTMTKSHKEKNEQYNMCFISIQYATNLTVSMAVKLFVNVTCACTLHNKYYSLDIGSFQG